MSRPDTRLITENELLLEAIEETARFVVEADAPDLPDELRERLIGHLTGAIFVRVAKQGGEA